MKPLTKSLHTVTAVSRVAAHLIALHPAKLPPAKAVDRALVVLGYDPKELPAEDPTVFSAIEATKRLTA